MLRTQTELELTALHSRENREEPGRPPKLVPAGTVIPACRELSLNIPETWIAAGIISATFLPPGTSQQNEESGRQPIRRLSVGTGPENPRDPINPGVMVPGLGIGPIIDVLANLMVWLAQYPGEDTRLVWEWLPLLRHQYPVSWTDAHAWAEGLLDDNLVAHHLPALPAVDWSGRSYAGIMKPDGKCLFLDPTLVILQAPAPGSVRVRETTSDVTGVVVGFEPGWSFQLRVDRVADVYRVASGVIDRGAVRLPRIREADTQVHTHSTRISRPGLKSRILAALAAPPSQRVFKRNVPEIEGTESYEATDLYEEALR